MQQHQCEPKLALKKEHKYSSLSNDKEDLYFALQEDVKELAELGCGKCIIELFKAVVEIYHSEEEKLESLNWLFKYADIEPPDFIEEEESIVHLICEMIHNNENWDGNNPVKWIQSELKAQESRYKNTNKEFVENIETNKAATAYDFKNEKNTFNKVPLEVVQKYFMQLSENRSSKNSQSYLSGSDIDDFILRAFCGDKKDAKITINCMRKEQLLIWRLFYDFYIDCTTDANFDSSKHKKEEYVKLISDNFNNWAYQSIYNNFSKSDKKKYWKSLKDFQ
jgi:hypothetical protein